MFSLNVSLAGDAKASGRWSTNKAVVSIMRLVWAALWRVVARIWRLLTTPFRNKTR